MYGIGFGYDPATDLSERDDGISHFMWGFPTTDYQLVTKDSTILVSIIL
jgi:hypothetical protein